MDLKMSDTNTTHYSKLADLELRNRYGVKKYRTAKRCPKCGHKCYRRRPVTSECFECVLGESKRKAVA